MGEGDDAGGFSYVTAQKKARRKRRGGKLEEATTLAARVERAATIVQDKRKILTEGKYGEELQREQEIAPYNKLESAADIALYKHQNASAPSCCPEMVNSQEQARYARSSVWVSVLSAIAGPPSFSWHFSASCGKRSSQEIES
jgi:hypothetical protein